MLRNSDPLRLLGCWLAVILPLTLTHFRAFAEIDFDILAVLFLVYSSRTEEAFSWVRKPWFLTGALWWIWQIICTIKPVLQGEHGGGGALIQSVIAIRFLVAAAALGEWILPDALWRRRMLWVTFGCTVYIAAQIGFQAVFGVNFFGQPRFSDGTLTGPYAHPRAAAPLSRLILPLLMVLCACWDRKKMPQRVLLQGGALLAAAMIMVLAGQRMPFALAMFGLCICALMHKPMRLTAFIGALGVPFLVMLTRLVSPGSFHHLITLTRCQLEHFAASPYGQIYTRVMVMALHHPLMGYGYDGYRHHCNQASSFVEPTWLSKIAATHPTFPVCVQHPHNLYAQALMNSGVPGLVIFSCLIVSILRVVWPGRAGTALQVGLFSAIFIQYWPFTSSSDFLNLPLGGWGFMLLGVALSYKHVPFTQSFPPLQDEPISEGEYGGSHVRRT
ncbi:O-antigen ligase family protein [Neokomagataea tanensis]|uniref:O-antigen ligase family protein n=1 Tax=Neokomagataea tanensis TaxID=661191 RepID=A0A4Y6V798_9PROT|nr:MULTISPECIES: O-antigen ligase family protein [Neokomagataea]QDH24367.1 O-antigen ligase family protein [Neokomagataea tanensis]